MSLDSESSPSSSSRDWFFPSHSFAHSSHQYARKAPKYSRRFSTNPRLSQPLLPDTRPPKTPPTFRSVSSSNSSSSREYSYAELRKRAYSTRRGEPLRKREDNDAVSNRNVGISEEKTLSREKIAGLSGQRLKFRWHMAISLAVAVLSTWDNIKIVILFHYFEKRWIFYVNFVVNNCRL